MVHGLIVTAFYSNSLSCGGDRTAINYTLAPSRLVSSSLVSFQGDRRTGKWSRVVDGWDKGRRNSSSAEVSYTPPKALDQILS